MIKNKVVVDTSVIIKWLNKENEDYTEQAKKLLLDCLDDKVTIIAPELAKYEVGNVLISGKQLTIQQASIVLDQLYKIPITFVEDNLITSKETFKIAIEAKITYYDSSFMALAQQYDATLVTDNFKHQGKSDKIKVIALAEY